MQKKYIHIMGYISLFMSIFFSCIFIFQQIFQQETNVFTGGENHIVFVLDVSQSMNVEDVDRQSRLTAAKKKIAFLMQENPGYDFALNIFAGESQRVLPFTQDISLFGTFLLGLDSKNLTVQGTNIQEALSDAYESFAERETGSIVILSDGDEQEIEISKDLQKLLDDKNISIHIVGVGSEGGGFIPNKLYNSKRIHVSLNEEGLIKLSKEIGGKYHSMDEAIDFTSRLDNNIVKNKSIPPLLFLAFLSWMLYLSAVYLQLYYKNR